MLNILQEINETTKITKNIESILITLKKCTPDVQCFDNYYKTITRASEFENTLSEQNWGSSEYVKIVVMLWKLACRSEIIKPLTTIQGNEILSYDKNILEVSIKTINKWKNRVLLNLETQLNHYSWVLQYPTLKNIKFCFHLRLIKSIQIKKWDVVDEIRRSSPLTNGPMVDDNSKYGDQLSVIMANVIKEIQS